jgi:hypothetical protein
MPQHVYRRFTPFVPLRLDGGLWGIVNTNPTHDHRHQQCDCQHTEHKHGEGSQLVTEDCCEVFPTSVRRYRLLWQQTVLLQLQF